MEAIRSSGIGVAFDAMYGTGQQVIRRLLPNAQLFHASFNPSFMGQAPEPIHRNLGTLSAFVAENHGIHCGIATDGDADRIGMYDEDGHFVDSHHILLLLLWYMAEYRKETGKVVVTFSVTDRMKRLAELYGLEVEITQIGFKYIAEIMARESVIVGGEESGGLAVKGHIPERDGIWIGLILLEFMAKTGKSLKQLIQTVYDKVGAFAFDRDDLHLEEAKKQAVIRACQEGQYKAFGEYRVAKSASMDGYKFYLDEAGDRWVMIRPSGTEPLLRVYCEAPTAAEVRTILDSVGATLLP
jgi:phosphomannomutase